MEAFNRPFCQLFVLCVATFAAAFAVVVFCEERSASWAFLSVVASVFVVFLVDLDYFMFSHNVFTCLFDLVFKPVC